LLYQLQFTHAPIETCTEPLWHSESARL